MLNKKQIAVLLIALLSSVASAQPVKLKATHTVTKKVYLRNKDTHGIIVLDVNWGRWWGCGAYENAQLKSLVFHKLPVSDLKKTEPSLVLLNPSRLFSKPQFMNYAFSLEPGEYLLSSFNIKAAKSISDIDHIV